MPQERSYPAGTNRSGTKRKRVTSTADNTASTDTAGGSAGRLEAGSDQGEQVLEGQTGDNVQLISERDRNMANETVLVPEDDGEVDSGKDGKDAVQPSPTNFDASRMPRTVGASVFVRALSEAQALRVKIGKCLKRCDRKTSELKGLEAEKE